MTSPRPYGSGYYAAPAFPDTPIYDSLVEERGTPQIAPIRVPSYDSGPHLPALPAPRAALPPAPVPTPAPAPAPHPHQPHGTHLVHTPQPTVYGHQAAPQPAPPQPFVPQQPQPPRWDQGYEQQRPQPQQPRPQQQPAPPGYEAMRPVAPRPAPPQPAQPARPASPQTYADQYARPYYQDGQRY
ncbi:hypothetical protein AA958_01810 [Streptomyces sp. CNQ-509]|uniref:DUF6643 family protein n=1 Tax=Streptomyces sp. CNQ-509 TaxID=444103 RepID=UPI00062DFD9A|nr:DUF6643 family protein [Streptomyces sp. CNQ-509]AKH81112.1 hypothetical protein AA958_01810 [Streptomyces sp. CNQ-509]